MNTNNFIGVKTTGIYCIPSCPAKDTRPENKVYFNTAEDAERHGFRPCKQCFPNFVYGKWTDEGPSVILKPPHEFSFSKCLRFLTRSSQEPCHRVEKNNLYKLEKFEDELVLMKIGECRKGSLGIDFLTPRPKKSIRVMAAKYVWHWFDLDIDLTAFYRMTRRDPVLKRVARDFYGLRIITIADLFEAVGWAIIGQQINLAFAYTLKDRFVRSFGDKLCFDNKCFYLFPTPHTVSRLTPADLKQLQFSGKKAEYIIALARKMSAGDITKMRLLGKGDFEAARKELMQLHGVGKWTADYVSLRCLLDRNAFPVDDVGLQNAFKQQLGLNGKPTGEDIKRLSERWHNWRAYATFYLWASLI
jgi:DNA-3-methyladenine glycosylase II